MTSGGATDGLPLAILGVGLRTCSGPTARTTVVAASAMRPPVRVRRVGGMRDQVASVAAVRALPDHVRGRARTALLAEAAMREACAGWSLGPVPALVVSDDGPRADDDPAEDGAWLAATAQRAGIAIDPRTSAVLPLGRAGVIVALLRAAALLRAPSAPAAVLVGGVHTSLAPLPSSVAEEIPGMPRPTPSTTRTLGEAAGFLLLARTRPADAAPPTIVARVVHAAARPELDAIEARRARERAGGRPGAATEVAVEDEEVVEAAAIEAWREVLTGAAIREPNDVGRVLADVRAASDATDHFVEGARTAIREAPAADLERGEALGDVGAAAPFVLAATALLEPALGLGHAGKAALVIGASEDRGGLVVLDVREAPERPAGDERVPAPSPARAVGQAARRELWRQRGPLSRFKSALHDAIASAAADTPPVVLPDPDAEDWSPDAWEALLEEPQPSMEQGGTSVAPACAAFDESLRALLDSDLWDDAHLERLDAAARAAERLIAAVPSPPGDELDAIEAVATATAAWLSNVRRSTVDRAAAVALLAGAGARRAKPPRGTRPDDWGPILVRRGATVAPGEHRGQTSAWLERDLELGPESLAARDADEIELLAAEAADEIVVARVARGPGPVTPPEDAAHDFAPVDLPTLDQVDARIGRLLLCIEELARVGGADREGVRADVMGAVQRVLPPGDLTPSRAFARALVLGCIEDDEAAFLAVRDLCDAPRLCVSAVADGLALATGRAVGSELIALCLEEVDPDRLASAVAAIAVRRDVPLAPLAVLLAHDAPAVRGAAARALGHTRARAAAGPILLSTSIAERDGATLAAELEALARLGGSAAVARARLALDERVVPPAPFLRLLGLVGGPEDRERIAGYAALPEALLALGWLGTTRAADVLVEVLASEAESSGGAGRSVSERALAAAHALQRLTGAVSVGGGLAASDLRTVDRHRLETRAEVWEKWLGTASFDPRRKTRWGQPWQPPVSLDEVDAIGARRADRASALLEVAARSPTTASALRDASDRASLQRAALAVARTT